MINSLVMGSAQSLASNYSKSESKGYFEVYLVKTFLFFYFDNGLYKMIFWIYIKNKINLLKLLIFLMKFFI